MERKSSGQAALASSCATFEAPARLIAMVRRFIYRGRQKTRMGQYCFKGRRKNFPRSTMARPALWTLTTDRCPPRRQRRLHLIGEVTERTSGSSAAPAPVTHGAFRGAYAGMAAPSVDAVSADAVDRSITPE
jgi:hypothetical protein